MEDNVTNGAIPEAVNQVDPELIAEQIAANVDPAVWAGLGIGLLVFIVVMILVQGFPLWKIAKRTNTPHAWMGWFPILQVFTIAMAARKPWWWGLIAILVAFIPFIGVIVTLIIIAWLFMAIAKRLGHPEWVGILTVIPVVNLVVYYYLALASGNSQGGQGGNMNSGGGMPQGGGMNQGGGTNTPNM